jgi:tetratricopeptide (TPR) repeat protein
MVFSSLILGRIWNYYFKKKSLLPDMWESSLQLVTMLSFFAPEDVSLSWFIHARTELPEPLQRKMGNETQRDAILSELTQHSFVTLNDGKMRINRAHMGIFRDAIKKEDYYPESERCILQFGAKLVFFDFTTEESRTEFGNLFPHMAAIALEVVPRTLHDQVALFLICSFLGNGSLDVWDDYDSAAEWYQKARALHENIWGTENPDIADNNIVAVYDSKGDCSRALEWYGKARAQGFDMRVRAVTKYDESDKSNRGMMILIKFICILLVLMVIFLLLGLFSWIEIQ